MNTLLLLATTDYSYSYTATDAAAATVVLLIITLGVIGGLIAYALTAWLTARIFKKASLPAWKAWVPVYNSWITLELGGKPGWWAVLALIPVVNIVAAVFFYIALYNIGLKLGKSGAFVLWAIFLPIVWYVWLAFDSSRWNATLGAPSLLAAGSPNSDPSSANTPPAPIVS